MAHKTASDFDYMSEIDHVIQRCNLYIGSIKPCTRNVDVYDPKKDKIEQRECSWSVGAIQLFKEILSNAVDNYEDTCARGYTNVDPSSAFIEIDMDATTISILNYG
jgi:DNA gyrase/topoisomerase IV subunit B